MAGKWSALLFCCCCCYPSLWYQGWNPGPWKAHQTSFLSLSHAQVTFAFLQNPALVWETADYKTGFGNFPSGGWSQAHEVKREGKDNNRKWTSTLSGSSLRCTTVEHPGFPSGSLVASSILGRSSRLSTGRKKKGRGDQERTVQERGQLHGIHQPMLRASDKSFPSFLQPSGTQECHVHSVGTHKDTQM